MFLLLKHNYKVYVITVPLAVHLAKKKFPQKLDTFLTFCCRWNSNR